MYVINNSTQVKELHEAVTKMAVRIEEQFCDQQIREIKVRRMYLNFVE